MTRPEKPLLSRGVFLCVALCITSCATRPPTWSHATAQQRVVGNFRYDDAYLDSPQFQTDMEESAKTVERIRHQIGKP